MLIIVRIVIPFTFGDHSTRTFVDHSAFTFGDHSAFTFV